MVMIHVSFHKRIYIVLVSNFMVKYNWAVKFGYFFVFIIGGQALCEVSPTIQFSVD